MTFGCLTHVSQGANIRWWLELDGAGAESVVCEIKQIYKGELTQVIITFTNYFINNIGTTWHKLFVHMYVTYLEKQLFIRHSRHCITCEICSKQNNLMQMSNKIFWNWLKCSWNIDILYIWQNLAKMLIRARLQKWPELGAEIRYCPSCWLKASFCLAILCWTSVTVVNKCSTVSYVAFAVLIFCRFTYGLHLYTHTECNQLFIK